MLKAHPGSCTSGARHITKQVVMSFSVRVRVFTHQMQTKRCQAGCELALTLQFVAVIEVFMLPS
jgi:hypothetical protein